MNLKLNIFIIILGWAMNARLFEGNLLLRMPKPIPLQLALLVGRRTLNALEFNYI
jgi:hypothetical protein